MCGRYVSPEEAAIERFWNLSHAQRDNPLGGRFNVSPTAIVPTLLLGETGALELVGARWGLIPFWWKEAKPPRLTFNLLFPALLARGNHKFLFLTLAQRAMLFLFCAVIPRGLAARIGAGRAEQTLLHNQKKPRQSRCGDTRLPRRAVLCLR